MTSLSQLITQHWPETVTFILIFGRTMGLIVGAPFWGSRTVPLAVRIWVAMLLAVATYPLIKAVPLPAGFSILSLLMTLSGEIFLGLMLGWLAQLLFAAVRLAGQEIEMKTCMGLVQLVDPHEGGHTGVFAAFLEVMAGMIFFALNGHHLLIQALSSSYHVFPLAGEKFFARVAAGLVSSTGEIFTIALRIAAPVLIGLLLTDVVLGILSRAIPQMNVFMVAQPVQFGFGILLLMLSLPVFVWFIARQLPLMIGVPGGVG
jgi:flagellar biosynthetic protein FliR